MHNEQPYLEQPNPAVWSYLERNPAVIFIFSLGEDPSGGSDPGPKHQWAGRVFSCTMSSLI